MTLDRQSTENGNHLDSPEIVELVAERLQELRKRLLDSSRRNPLVNIPFRANSTSVLRVVDELPDILRFNLTSGTDMRLVALPAIDEQLPDEQTDAFLDELYLARSEDETYIKALDALDPSSKDFEEKALVIERALKDRVRAALELPERQTKESPSLAEHARAHGISPDYELPYPEDEHEDGRHQDTDIQTLMLPEKLSRIAKGLLEKGRGFERETGVNVLHVAFGLLEWKSQGEKDKCVSPLALLEIRIERKQSPRGAQFYLSGEGEVVVNTTLKQKLFTEHRLDLPEYTSGTIEDYFQEVAEAAPSGWHWTVRREVAVGIFPSSKIAMYHDLDPEQRPVAENPVVGKLLATTGSGENAYAQVYETDEPETARKVPHLVMDADASQFSALVDVADGQHVSIEGPPGSGKSQTIVNLVAAALADRKRVLFVAEKLTALDVVKNRLEASGLGEFILPLQAGRGTRDHVYDSLDERLSVEASGSRADRNFASRQSALERRRQALQDYLDALGSPFGTSGFTVYDVIGHGIATHEAREEVPKEVRRIALADCESLGEARIDGLVADAEGFADRLGRSRWMPTLWREATATILNRDDAEDACESLAKLADRIEAFAAAVAESDAAPLFGEGPFATDIAGLQDLVKAITANEGMIDAALVEQLTDDGRRRVVQDFCGQVQERRTLVGRLGRRIADPEGWGLADRLRAAGEFAQTVGGRIDPIAHRDRIADLDESMSTVQARIALAETLPARWAENEDLSLSDIQGAAGRLLGMPYAALAHRRADPDRKAAEAANGLQKRHTALSTELGRIRQGLPRAGDHKPDAMRRAAADIEGAGLLRFMSSDYKAARNTYTNILGGDGKDDRETMAARLRAYADWLESRTAFATDKELSDVFGPAFSGLATDLAHIHDVVALHVLCAEIAGEDAGLRNALEAGDLASLRAFAAETDMPDMSLAELRRELEGATAVRAEEERRKEEAATHIEMFRDARSMEAEELSKLQVNQERVEKITALIEESDAAQIIGDRFKGVSTRTDALTVECTTARLLAEAPDPALAISVLRSGQAGKVEQALHTLGALRAEIEAEAEEIARILGLDPETGSAKALSGRLADMRAAAGDPSSLMERARLRKAESTLRDEGFGLLVDWALDQGESLDPSRIGPIVRAIIAKSMADRAYQIHGEALQGYDGEEFDRIRAEIVEKDRELIRMSRDVVRNGLIANANPPAGNGIGRKSSYTDMSLLRNEMGKKRNRIGVRELTRRAGGALLELKPCWMMSPLAVAQYLHSGLTFDLVVIDEASQMTPENAIGALSRARQAVIVGDTKQLPPTTFFQKMLDDADIDEDLREDSESVLDMANMAFRPVRQLRWHYRSRHSALIRFSNTWMYDEKLTIFPSAREDDPEFGVHLEEVSGIYKGRTNEIEARKVVQAAVSHMRNHPNLSLGVCTMNSDQKELIREEFERELERNPNVQEYVRDWQERDDALEEFFIKNLETIQGDERDVMFISTLYGPESPGARVHQRFGPINSVHGHRRLNVLFTRAKRKIVTFTSLKPTDILAGEEKARGVRMFRAWLEYCASGHVPDKVGGTGETESPFEDYVAAQIEALGCEVVPQVGAAGYRIDLGVRHPDWQFGFILGVECDGASYHSSKSSRDRDRLRQEVLEGLGWRFHRIWSTDWFNDPRTQVDRLREAINDALEAARRSGATLPAPVTQHTDEGDVVDAPEIGPSSPLEEPRVLRGFEKEDLFSAAAPAAGQHDGEALAYPEMPTNPIIKLGSHVKLETLGSRGRKLAFTIVEDGNALESGKLGIHTPLGQALIDAQEGDEIEYQVGVEIREVRVIDVS